MIHLALQKRAVLVHLLADLAIGVVQRRLQEGYPISLSQGLPRFVVAPDLGSPGMTAATRFHLSTGRQRRRALGNSLARRERPAPPCRVREWGDQPARGISKSAALPRFIGPRDVAGTGAMTRFAG